MTTDASSIRRYMFLFLLVLCGILSKIKDNNKTESCAKGVIANERKINWGFALENKKRMVYPMEREWNDQ